MNKNFWKNKKVLITGHTGFKGSWMTLILHSLGAKIYGYALNPNSNPNFFDGLDLKRYLEKDIRANVENNYKFKNAIDLIKPEIVFHMAAQSSVLVSYKNPLETFKTNVMGTVNVLEALKNSKSVKSAIIVTTDKVYLNLEKKKKFNELDHLGGYDIYSGSKACAEVITHSYDKSFFNKSKCNIATVRSGNCIGGGDWTKDRIIKDCAESLIFNKNITIRSPNASRPWQHVMEPVFGYIKLAKNLYFNKKFRGAWNFGPNLKNNMKVIDVVKYGKKILDSKSKIKFEKQKYYESQHLSLDSAKSAKKLSWKTYLKSEEALSLAFDWYKFYYTNKNRNKKNILDFTFIQINNYKKLFLNNF
ncbi:CDP-glucose 4,6-dehydratase [Pelagibacteraceae bacterium]|nr:CDP-glucose 4,6-dehydratase [Pelagibacteraceae bacterium]